MAKKVGYKAKKSDNPKKAKIIFAARSSRTGAYTFKHKMVLLDQVDETLKVYQK